MQRILSLDILKLFAMFLVIWGHCVQHLLSSHFLDEPAYIYIYSFHMPLFFMISGLFVHRMPVSAAQCVGLLLTKARQLILPCIAWGLLMGLGNMLLPFINGTTPDKPLWSTLWTNFWFLKSLFFCFCLWYISVSLVRKPWLAALVSLIISQCIVVHEVQWSYPAFLAGIYVGAHLDTIRRYRRPIALSAFIIGGLLLIGWNKSFFTLPSVYAWSTLPSDAILLSILMRLYRFAVNLTLSLGFIALFLGIDAPHPIQQSTASLTPLPVLYRLASYGRLTLGIYIIHSMFFMVRERICPTLLCCDSLYPWLFNIVVAPLLSVVLLLVCIVLTRLLMRLPWLSFFFLGTPLPKRQAA